MASIAAKAVAEEVLGTVGNGKIPNITKIALKKGYKYSTANGGQIQKTKTYLRVVIPVVSRLEAERDRAIALMGKKISKAKYRDLTDSIDKLTKNIQLLSGGATERTMVLHLSATIAKKNGIDSYARQDSE